MISTIVGFAISMAFLFLMLSAACSAIQEIVANLFRWRAATLERGLAGLLMSAPLKDELYRQPLLESLCSPNARGQLRRLPSYIPSATLALAILQVAEDHGMTIDGCIAKKPPTGTYPATEKLLASLLRGCTGVTEQRQRLEDWLDNSMGRVSGWYKRKAHAWIWIFGIVLSLMLNADSISLSKRFWNDQALRDAVSAEATEYVKSAPKDASGNDQVKDQAELDRALHRMNLFREHLPGVPLGWCFVDTKSKQAPVDKGTIQADGLKATCWPDLVHPTTQPYQVSLAGTDPRIVDLGHWSWWLWKVIGVVATVLAISQGAPFWFDLLQKAVNLRLAGTPPAPADAKK
jgi:hypothetical protein